MKREVETLVLVYRYIPIDAFATFYATIVTPLALGFWAS